MFVFALCVAGLVIAAMIGWAIWRNRKARSAGEQEVTTVVGAQPTSREREMLHREGARTQDANPEFRPMTWTRELLSKLEWKRFEDVVAAYSRELGYEARTTRIGADGGVDVQLFQQGQSRPVMIVQCKAWDAYKVGVKPVRELFGVMAAEKVANGAFFTTGEFTAEAEAWAQDKNLDLVNGSELISRIRSLAPTAQQTLLACATEGDYTTPTCPSCGVKMVLRTATKGRSAGSDFWGCRNYPRCKQTFRLASEQGARVGSAFASTANAHPSGSADD